MNTNDVRNMKINQWVFWVIAVPLTVIIITLCLIWAGELENVWKGFRNLWVGNKNRGGSAGVSYSILGEGMDAYSIMNSRAQLGRRRERDYEEEDWPGYEKGMRVYEQESYRRAPHVRSRLRARGYDDD